MAGTGRHWRRWLHRALVVGGITLGALFLLFLQLAVPSFFGPIGLFVIGLVDATIYLEFHHHRTVQRKLRMRSGNVLGPENRIKAVHYKRHLEIEFRVTIALLVFVLGLCLEGVGLGADASSNGTGFVPLLLGTLLTIAAYSTLLYYGWASGIGYLGWGFVDTAMRTESELWDTTDDH